MNKYLLPRTKVGIWSLVLIVSMPVLFSVGTSFTTSLYKSVPAGNSIPEDILVRPALALTMLAGMAVGIFAFVLGLVAIIKKQERSVPVFIATIVGALLGLFLIGEILFPH